MSIPFIIYALPRSRTAWLSKFLTYKDWECYHESAVFMRSIDDVKSFFASGNVGCAETGVAQGYHLIRHIVPNIKEVVLLRPVEDVIRAILDTNIDTKWDERILRRNMEYGDRVLRKIAKDKNALVVNYNDLTRIEICKEIFEHCLPYKFDKKWYNSLKDKNIQVDMSAFFCYYFSHREAIERFKSTCKQELTKLCRTGELNHA